MVNKYKILMLSIMVLSINFSTLAASPTKQFAARPGAAQLPQASKVLCPETLSCEKAGNCGTLSPPWTKVVTNTNETGIFIFVSAQAANKSWPSQAQCNYKKIDSESHATLSINSGTNKLEQDSGNWGAGIYPWFDTCPSSKPDDCVMIWDKLENSNPPAH
jgi:hypothetical protein